MPREYDDPIYAEVIDAATALALELRAQRPSAALTALADEAVDAVFCTCVTTAADAVAAKQAPVHAGLIAEVQRRVEQQGRPDRRGQGKPTSWWIAHRRNCSRPAIHRAGSGAEAAGIQRSPDSPSSVSSISAACA